MQRLLLVLILFIGFSQRSNGQATCDNIGFENGDLSGWTLSNGSVNDVNQKTVFQDEVPGTFENGHLLTRPSDGNDPRIPAIPMVAPGSNYSIRIGNVTRGSRFDRIKTSFVVTPDNVLLQYKFAVILQFPNHQPWQQPGFSIRVTNQDNATLACNFYEVTAAATIDGFQIQNDIRYRNWTTGAIDLRNYIGQKINIEVTVNGCTERRHFGYAYFDAQCVKAEISQAPYCPAYDPTITLKAPEGFAAYRWSNGATSPNVAVAPKQGEKYWVKVKPFSSLGDDCEFQFDHTVNFTVPGDPTREDRVICEGDGYTIGDSTYRRAGTFLTRISRGPNVCDSVVITTLRVTPLARFAQSKVICAGEKLTVGPDVLIATGTYQTRIARKPPLCDSIVTTTLDVRQIALALTPDTYLRPQDSTRLNVEALPGGSYRYDWQSPAGLACANCAATWAKPPETTRYTVTVTDQDHNCTASASVLLSVGLCTVFAPNAFTPNGDGHNDIFFLEGSTCVERIDEMIIYDRWGEVICRRENFQPSEPDYGWDGMYRGAKAEAGLYPYRITVTFRTGSVFQQRGVVTLLR